MDLGDAVEVARPGIPRIGIALLVAAKLQQGLDHHGRIERIGPQLHLGQGQGKELAQLELRDRGHGSGQQKAGPRAG